MNDLWYNVAIVTIYLGFLGGVGFILYYALMFLAMWLERDPMGEVSSLAQQGDRSLERLMNEVYKEKDNV